MHSFASDNRSGACPEVIAAIAEEAGGFGGGYGDDDTTKSMQAAFDEMFERRVKVFPVSTGTAATALALAGICPPWGAVLCSVLAHVYVDESGGPEFYGHGLRLATVAGSHGRIDASALADTLDRGEDHGVHSTALSALSLTQATEAGTVYTADQTAELSSAARAAGCRVHLDGARFANAVASTGSSPADLTRRAGVDVAVWGGTKNGAIAAEAVVFFDDALATDFERRRKRGGHLHSKLRFTSAQLLALLRDDVWLRNAAHANAMAVRIGEAVSGGGLSVAHPVEANMVFVDAAGVDVTAWRQRGVDFYLERHDGRDVARLVTSYATTPAEVDALIATLPPVTPG